MKIYNLFPLLAGPVRDWTKHLERAADMGFDWIFVNPIQQTGQSGSLYSIKDYFKINPAFVTPRSAVAPDEQFKKMAKTAKKLGLRLMVDLVINHCAYDSALLKEHPDWFVHENGRIAHPYCTHDGEKVVWRDLARFDHQHTRDPEGLYQYCLKIVEYLLGLGFSGLRCDAAYQIPSNFWHRLISDIRKKYPDTVFTAETLGCSPDQTKDTARAGFDFIFNSSKWWDLSGPWLMEQYHLTRETVPSISFPESHDTPRLFEESHGNLAAMKQRYLFAALFSAGVMLPMGYEFGFRKPLHVVDTKPSDWETTDVDLTDFIRHANKIKDQYAVFREESITEVLGYENSSILLMWKAATKGKGQALIVLNKDAWNWQTFRVGNLCQYVQSPPPLVDVSPEWPMAFLPAPFEFDLHPGMGRILVTA
ncbi:alpha-amylase family glycosyl hydrolase [Methylomagnum sp.]